MLIGVEAKCFFALGPGGLEARAIARIMPGFPGRAVDTITYILDSNPSSYPAWARSSIVLYGHIYGLPHLDLVMGDLSQRGEVLPTAALASWAMLLSEGNVPGSRARGS